MGEAMTEVRNSARARLDSGVLALGVGLRQARTMDIAPAMRACGFDWLFIDLEHGSMDLDMAAQISVAALGAGVAPIVRVPNGAYSMATRALDNGALGIVIPHVETAAEAREVVAELKYPPAGHRSIAGALPQFGFAPPDLATAVTEINRATLVVVMIETAAAVAKADAIAAVPGVDVLLIGTNDLAADFGVTGNYEDDRIVAAYRTVIAACHAHGKWPGMGGIYGAALLERYVGLGMRFILAGNDLGFLMAAARERAGLLRALPVA